MKLGEWPAMGIPEARRARDEQGALVARGLDPAHERKRTASLASVTLESAARAWDASRAGQVDEHTRHTAMRRLEMYVFPTLGARHPRSINPSDITAALDPVVAAGQRETANRTAAVLDAVFAWAEMRGDVATNPAKLVKGAYPKAPTTHYAAIVEPTGFGGLLRAIDGYSGFVVRQALRPEPQRPRCRYRPWAELMMRTFSLDVLCCPRCSGRLRLVALMTEPKEISRYLRALGESTSAPARRPARGPPFWSSRVLRRRAGEDDAA